MNYFKINLTILTALVAHNSAECANSAKGKKNAQERPNVIVILADDMGYSDLGCYGSEISTPNLDRLAAEGVRLSQFRNGGMSMVTRTSLMTGLWYPATGMPKKMEAAPMLSEQMQNIGYQTALLGKWHVRHTPNPRGFDLVCTIDRELKNTGMAEFFDPARYEFDDEKYTNTDDFYCTEAFSARAVDYINKLSSEKRPKPFFIYLTYQAPHAPLQARREDIMKYRGRYMEGWQALRDERFERQKQLGIIPAETKPCAYPENLPQWETLSDEQRDLEDLRMAVYAAMIESMDRGIGEVMAALDENGIADNTLILFFSDNGTDCFPNTDAGQVRLPGEANSCWAPATGWAYAAVTPWRQYKVAQHGGGITTGAVLRYPNKVKDVGAIYDQNIHVVDLIPTLDELIGFNDPRTATHGESFLPLLQGEEWERERPLYFHVADNRAIRDGEWILTEVDGACDVNPIAKDLGLVPLGWELYNKSSDPYEYNNLADTHPDVVERLAAMWESWWSTHSNGRSYTPQPNPGYRPQGDSGSGMIYKPWSMLKGKEGLYPLP